MTAGYGTSSLRQDVQELDELLDYLLNSNDSQAEQPRASIAAGTPQERQSSQTATNAATEKRRKNNVILIGHSTGCQDAVFYMKHGRPDLRAAIGGVVLQAPVSDREWRESLPETAGFVAEARALAAAAEAAAAAAAQGEEGRAEGTERLMPAAAEADAPITVSRYLSLSTKVSIHYYRFCRPSVSRTLTAGMFVRSY